MSHDNSAHSTGRVEQAEDLFGDLAGRYRSTAAATDVVPSTLVDADSAALERDGYLVIERLLPPQLGADLAATLPALLGPVGRNDFEGRHTQRAYSLLAKTRVCDHLVEHPRVLALLDRLLMPNYLLSQLQAIRIGPGANRQLPHFDDGMYPVPRPRAALSAATIWAITDFTADNGATVVIPGSHRWDDARRPTDSDEHVSIAMPAGSVVFFLGTLWHGGGANHTADRRRLAVTAQYCQPWLRPQEAFTLSTPPATARTVSENIRRMIGYSIHPPFLGMVDGMHPKRVLDIPE
ncbi:phytanoyl-CoA dioxygenase family protein [Nocardia asteroides]|uniref:phytanoyl-CoA dioxygenase family protein n=1 Tax=Nocardia asteroides TaxID=1824 RepID=UPI001E3B1288|nr:phytanoyl-CoA dioxygenase family protein [Nocardia asteroides]UGT61823.1 phytanoyl-CoA dioxygenase family protein [Nocardia asteroides]